jgi:ketosteroid isomerase-like protein
MSIEAKIEIYELISKQDNAYDSENLEKFLDTWADGGVFSSNAFGYTEGKPALKEWFLNFQKMFNGKRHVVSNHEVNVDGDKATAYCYLSVFERVGTPALLGTATFTDTIIKDNDGKWRFIRRDQFVDPSLKLQ